MKILVTGAAGRLGSAIGKHLVSRGHEVTGTDVSYKADLGFPLKVADLRRRDAVYEPMMGAQAVVHLGNLPNAHHGAPQIVYADNVTMNINVFQAAAEIGVKQVVFASSVQTIAGLKEYHSDNPEPIRFPHLPLDGDTPPNPGNTYALSKIAGEQALRYYWEMWQVASISLRFPWVCPEDWVQWLVDNPKHRGIAHEAFSYLLLSDACSLVGAVLEKGFTGARVYFPTARENFLGLPASEVAAKHLPSVPLKDPSRPLDHLVDPAALERDFGWRASDRRPFTDALTKS